MKKKSEKIKILILIIFTIAITFIYTNENKSKNKVIETQKNYEKYAHLNIKSSEDFNYNQIDDYTDFVNGARKDALKKPRYDGRYISENQGYPPDNIGVCTDVIWRAFKEAGYNLRDMVNADIDKNINEYKNISGKPDPNIDFRRVINLRVFFQRHAKEITTELDDPKDWQMGDIIIFNPNEFHIGMCSDKRNRDGFPLIFHNAGQTEREEDAIKKYKIAYHFRFDASEINPEILIRFD